MPNVGGDRKEERKEGREWAKAGLPHVRSSVQSLNHQVEERVKRPRLNPSAPRHLLFLISIPTLHIINLAY